MQMLVCNIGRMKICVLMAALALVGCGEKKNDSKPDKSVDRAEQPPGPAKPADSPKGDTPGDKPIENAGGDKTPEADDKAMCADSCQLLAKYSLAALEGGLHEKICDGEKMVFLEGYCQAFDEARNCIYAASGYKFKKKKWQRRFSRTSWYKGRHDFKDGDLSAVATANVRELKKRADACREAKKVGDGDKKLVRDWLATKKLPKILQIWDIPQTPEHMRDYLRDFSAKDKLIITRVADPHEKEVTDEILAAHKGKKLRHLQVEEDTCPRTVEKDEDGEDMECYNPVFWITFDESNNVIAVWGTAAACPHVYAGRGDAAPEFQGEILRHLAGRKLEARQSLALTTETECGSPVRVRLSENKPEITYLDEVYLQVGDRRIPPGDCAVARYCANDGRYHRLAPGDSLELVFDIPDRLACTPATLVADGYYAPLAK